MDFAVSATANPARDRRGALRSLAAIAALLVGGTPDRASGAAIPFLGGGQERRQLELCLVTILRIRYWSDAVAGKIERNARSAPPGDKSDGMKAPYLEARLGAKALLTGRKGGGSNFMVYTLSGLQLKGCLKDTEAWYTESLRESVRGKGQSGGGAERRDRRRLSDASETIIDSLATVVEFDGLETTQDPSPRSSLMLGMYTNDKAELVRRMLQERTVPSCDILLDCFGPEIRGRCERYMRENYPGEAPQPPPLSSSEMLVAYAS